MPYRPPHAGLELAAGSVVGSILPAAFKAAFLASVLVCLIATLGAAVTVAGDEGLGASGIAAMLLTSVFGFLLFLFLATIMGTIFSAFYIAVIGTPLALLLQDRIDSGFGLLVTLAAAIIGALIAASLFGDFNSIQPQNRDSMIVMLAFAYALPAGLYFRRDIIMARTVSPWAED